MALFVERIHGYTRDGTTFDLDENEPDILCVVSPIRDGGREIVAGISLSATRPFMPKERMQALVPVMKAAAKEISVKLGHR